MISNLTPDDRFSLDAIRQEISSVAPANRSQADAEATTFERQAKAMLRQIAKRYQSGAVEWRMDTDGDVMWTVFVRQQHGGKRLVGCGVRPDILEAAGVADSDLKDAIARANGEAIQPNPENIDKIVSTVPPVVQLGNEKPEVEPDAGSNEAAEKNIQAMEGGAA